MHAWDLEVYRWFKIEQKDKIKEWSISSPFPSHTQLSLLVHQKKTFIFLFGLAWSVFFTEDISHTREHLRNFFTPHFSIFGPSLCLRVCRCKAAMTPSFLVRNSIYVLCCRKEKSSAKRKKYNVIESVDESLIKSEHCEQARNLIKIFLETKFFLKGRWG